MVKDYKITQREIEELTTKKPCGKPLGVYDVSNKTKEDIKKKTVNGKNLRFLEYYDQN
jgi:hypothetical protein